MNLGIAYVPTLPPESLRAMAVGAEQAGLDELWVWEDCFKQSGIASAAAALAWTSRIRVGIGLLPAPLRNVALCAMEFANLERMFPGRVVAGVGHGVQDWMGQAGARVASPMTLLEEYATAIRGLLSGERLSVEGRYVRLDGVALDWPPSSPPPLMIGGTGPKSLALAGRLGDGSLLGTAMTVEEVRRSCETILGASSGSSHPIAVNLIAATGPGARERVEREVPRWGNGGGLDRAAVGDAPAVAEVMRAMGAAGVTSVAVQPTEDEPDLPGLLRFLAEDVRPLL